jgi:hypothetical protein
LAQHGREAQRAGADGDAVTVLQLMLKLLFAVDEYFIRAAFDLAVYEDAVDDRERSVVAGPDMRVMSRGARVIEHHLIIRRASDHTSHAVVELMLYLPSAGVGNFQYGHRN